MRNYIAYVVLLIALSGCTGSGLPSLERLPGPSDLPFIHKIDVQQGNVITQDMVAQLRPDMDKKKVQFIMGTPIIKDTFNDDRWDYLYTYRPGGGDTERRLITLVFVDEKLSHVSGDVTPAEGALVAELHHDTSVKVPRFRQRSFLTRMKDRLPFTDDFKEVAEAEDEEITKQEAAEIAAIFARELPEPESAYANIQAAPGEGIVVPPDAPTNRKKKGFFARLLGSSSSDNGDDDEDFDPGDARYRGVTDPDSR